ncbi:hypothetical protein C8J56DRAFT_780504, partial [Mycena floridula]
MLVALGSVSPAHQTYARLLLPHRCGYPLWIPESDSNLPAAYKEEGVRIGDLGYLSDDGGFNYLFNICEASDHPINTGRTPQGFRPLSLNSLSDVRRIPGIHRGNTDISSLQIQKLQISVPPDASSPTALPEGFRRGFEFQSTSSAGAILMLPDGGSRCDLLAHKPFRLHAFEHAVSWYRFVNDTLGREVRNGSLYLITGCDKAASWGVASFSDCEADGSVSLKFLVLAEDGDNNHLSYTWQTHNSIAHRTGATEDGNQNNCVFLRGFRIAIQP